MFVSGLNGAAYSHGGPFILDEVFCIRQNISMSYFKPKRQSYLLNKQVSALRKASIKPLSPE